MRHFSGFLRLGIVILAGAMQFSVSAQAQGQLSILGSVQAANLAYTMHTFGSWVLVAAGNDGLKAVDIWDINNPTVRAEKSGLGDVADVAGSSLDAIYVLSRNVTWQSVEYDEALFVIRLYYDSEWVLEVRSFTPLQYGLRGESLTLQYNKLNVSCRNIQQDLGFFFPVDISNPDSPVVENFQRLKYPAFDSYRLDEFIIFYAAGPNGFAVQRLPGYPAYDFINPDPRVDTPGYTSRVHWQWETGLCFVADGEGGVRIIDPRNPNYPYEMEAFESVAGGEAQDFLITRDAVFAAYGSSGLVAVGYSGTSDVNQDGDLDFRDVFLAQDFISEVTPAILGGQTAQLAFEMPPQYVCALSDAPGDNRIVMMTEDGMLATVEYTPPALPVQGTTVNLWPDDKLDHRDLCRLLERWKEF